MVVSTRRRSAGIERAPRVESRPKRNARSSTAQHLASTSTSKSIKRDRQVVKQSEAESDLVDMLSLHDSEGCLSSPILSRPTSSIFDDDDSIKGWASGSSHNTEYSIQSRLSGKRKSVAGRSRKGNTLDNEVKTASPTLISGSNLARSRKLEDDHNHPSRSLQRSQTDPQNSATTPPSAQRAGPNRPQSAMKHRSANKYSSRIDESVFVVTSVHQMPKRESDSGLDHLLVMKKRKKSIKNTPSDASDMDPDAFSPDQLTKRAKATKYALRSRQGLPKSDYYERTKEEEGSPTPETRRRDFSV